MSPFRSRGTAQQLAGRLMLLMRTVDGSGIEKLPQVMIPGERGNRYVLDIAREL
jgi:hypothetical protein